MSRYDRRDIMMELIELSRDLKTEIMQQLNYYRASVYKNETAAVVERKIEQDTNFPIDSIAPVLRTLVTRSNMGSLPGSRYR